MTALRCNYFLFSLCKPLCCTISALNEKARRDGRGFFDERLETLIVSLSSRRRKDAMQFPYGFPAKYNAGTEAKVLTAMRDFKVDPSPQIRVLAGMNAFANAALTIVRRGEWKAELAHPGFEQFLTWLSMSECQGVFGRLPSSMSDNMSYQIKISIMGSESWIGYMRKLAKFSNAKISKSSKRNRKSARSSTKTKSVRKMEKYRVNHALTWAEFAKIADTTERTLRRFRKTGKLRGNILASIALAMGTTKEKLLSD
ncbi:MAG TPA: hypothetical protein VK709_18705 [Candidatus Saccharimonadales bacterium]|jgi:hypothetical protein|nr:hypothetical protein [Candidatus Saccharimonadales bacterium]